MAKIADLAWAIEVDDSKALAKLEKYKKYLEELDDNMSQLGRMKMPSLQIGNSSNEVSALRGQIKDLTAELNQLKSAFDSLTKEQKNGSAGGKSVKTLFDIQNGIERINAGLNETLRLAKQQNTSYSDMVNQLAVEQKELRQIQIHRQALNKLEDAGKITAEQSLEMRQKLIRAELEHKQASNTLVQSLRNEEKTYQTIPGSMNQMAASLEKLRRIYRDLDASGRESPFGEGLLKNIQEMDARVKQLDATIGNHQRNVGNYALGYDGLAFSIQQVAREIPNAAYGARVFFMAISNNLPILADEIKRARLEIAAAKRAGEDVVPLGKRIMRSIFSWQTLLVAGITILTTYGDKIVEWVANLFKSKNALDAAAQAQEKLGEAFLEGSKNAQEEIVKLNILYKAATDKTKSDKDRIAATKELQSLYPDYLGNMSQENIMAGNAASAYADLSKALIKVAQTRAVLNKMTEVATKNVELETKKESLLSKSGYKDIEKVREAYQKLNTELKNVSQTDILVSGRTGGDAGRQGLLKRLKHILDIQNEINANIEVMNKMESGVDIKSITTPPGQKPEKSVDKVTESMMLQVDTIRKAEEQYKKYLQIMNSSDALKKVQGSIDINFSPDTVEERIKKIYNSLGNTEEAQKAKAKIEAIFVDMDFTKLKNEFDKTMSQISSEISNYKEKYNLYEQLLGITGDQNLALKMSFGIDFEGFPDLTTYLADQIRKIAASQFGIVLNFDVKNKNSIRNQIGDIYKNLPDILKKQIDKLDEIRQNDAEETARLYAKNLAEFGNLEKRRLAIAIKYEKQIQAARKMGDEGMAQKLEGKRDLELMQLTEDYVGFFSWIEAMSSDVASNIHSALRNQLNEMLQAGKITIEEYAKAAESIDAQMAKKTNEQGWFTTVANGGVDGLISKFQSLGQAMELKGAAKGDAKMQAMGKNMQAGAQKAAIAIAVVDAVIKLVHSSIQSAREAVEAYNEFMDSKGLEATESKFSHFVEALSEFDNHAAKGWEKLKSGDVLGATSETVQSYLSIITTFNKIHDRKIEKQIEKSRLEVEKLKNAYSDIENIISRTLGGAEYADLGLGDVDKRLKEINEQLDELRKKSIRNIGIRYSPNYEALEKEQKRLQSYNKGGAYALQRQNLIEQQGELRKQMQAEIDKKKTDQNKVDDYQKQIKELDDAIRHFAEDTLKDLYGIDLKDWASQIGDALFDAWKKGEDGVTAFRNKVGELMGQVMNEILKIKILEPLMKEVGDKLFGTDGQGGYFGEDFNLTENEVADIAKTLLSANEKTKKYSEAMDRLEEAINKYGLSMKDVNTSGGLIKESQSLTEQTGSLLASYINAIRAYMAGQQIPINNIDLNVARIAAQLTSGINTPISNSNGVTEKYIAQIAAFFLPAENFLRDIDLNIESMYDIQLQCQIHLANIEASTANNARIAQEILDRLNGIVAPVGSSAGGMGIRIA